MQPSCPPVKATPAQNLTLGGFSTLHVSLARKPLCPTMPRAIVCLLLHLTFRRYFLSCCRYFRSCCYCANIKGSVEDRN